MVFINFNNNIKNIKLPNTINDLNELITQQYNISDFYIITNNKLLTPNNYKYVNNDNSIFINQRIRGGVLDVLEPIFAPIITPFKQMISAIVDILALILEFIKLIPKILEIATTIFKPDKLLNDIIYGSITGINSMISALLQQITDLFGDHNSDSSNDGGVFGIEDNTKKVCVKPTLINLIILILCPPLALFLNKGWRNIFMVIVCGLMTYYLYYFPGLLFAALYILC